MDQKVVHSDIVKKLTGTPFYELRIKVNQEYRIILISYGHQNFVESTKVVLLNGFIKKSTKDYQKAIEIASGLIEKFKRMIELTDASLYLNKEIGLDGTPERISFKNDAYSYYFGEILKNRRKELKLSQEELADRVGKQRPYISRIENGEDVRISNLVQIAQALGLSFELKPIKIKTQPK
jgi:DNA-binding XRE family transcriptional regulator